MRRFDYTGLENRTWDNEVINFLSLIHEYKGRHSVYIKQKPQEKATLKEQNSQIKKKKPVLNLKVFVQ